MPDITATKTISFFGTCSANSEETLVSQRIMTPFRVSQITANFALNTNRTLQLGFFLSPDKSDPSSGEPSGFNILDEYGQVDYIVGDNEQKILHNNASSDTFPSWLKVYANNTDAHDHTVDVQVEIELFERE